MYRSLFALLCFINVFCSQAGAQAAPAPKLVYEFGKALYASNDLDNGILFSADNRFLVLTGQEAIKVYDTNYGLPIATFSGENYWYSTLSRNSKYLRFLRLRQPNETELSCYDEIVNLFTGKPLTIVHHKDQLDYFTKAIGEETILAHHDVNQLDLTKTDSSKKLSFTEHHYTVSDDQQWVALERSMFSDSVTLVNTATFQTKNIYISKPEGLTTNQGYFIEQLTFTQQSRYLLLMFSTPADDQYNLRCYDLQEGKIVLNKNFYKPRATLFSPIIQWNDKSNLILLQNKTGFTCYDLTSHQDYPIPVKTTSPGTSVQISPTGNYFLFKYKDSITIFNLKQRRWDQTLRASYRDLLPGNNHELVYLNTFGDTAMIYDLSLQQIVKKRHGTVRALSANDNLLYGTLDGLNGLFDPQLNLIRPINNGSENLGKLTVMGDFMIVSPATNTYNMDRIRKEAHFGQRIWRISTFQKEPDEAPPYLHLISNTSQALLYDDNNKVISTDHQTSLNCDSCGYLMDISGATLTYLKLPSLPDLAKNIPAGDSVIMTNSGSTPIRIKMPNAFYELLKTDTLQKKIYAIALSGTQTVLYRWDFKGRLLDSAKLTGCPGLSSSDDHFSVEDNGYILHIFKQLSLSDRTGDDYYYRLPGGALLRKGDSKHLTFIKTGAAKILVIGNGGAVALDTLAVYSLDNHLLHQELFHYLAVRDSVVAGFWPDNYQPLLYPNSGKLIIENWVNKKTLYTRELFNEFPNIGILDKDIIAYPLRNNSITIENYRSGGPPIILVGHQDYINNLVFTPNLNYLISSSFDGSIRKWSLKENRELASIYYLDEANYLITTPEGYYQCTKRAIPLFGYVLNNNLYPATQFDLFYNRPDLVMKRLGNPDILTQHILYQAWKKRLAINKISNMSTTINAHGPQISLTKRSTIPLETNDEIIQISIHLVSGNHPITFIKIVINGCTLNQQGRISLVTGPEGSDKVVPVSLARGNNQVAISAVDEQGTESAKSVANIIYHPLNYKKPTYYFIGLGIDLYQEPGKNLNYAIHDIKRLDSVFIQRYGDTLQSHLYTDSLVNEQTLNGIRKILKGSTKEDIILLAISGHGLLSDSLDFYLATGKTSFHDPVKNSLSYDELEGLLKNIPARKKLLLIDACYSGVVDKQGQHEINQLMVTDPRLAIQSAREAERKSRGASTNKNSFEYMQDLFADITDNDGTVVLSSARGYQQANEGSQFGNGLFSYCLLNTLSHSKKGSLNLSALAETVNANLHEISQGLQNSSLREDNIVNDWLIW